MGWFIIGVILGVVIGFLVGIFWNSRKIKATVAAIKTNPITALEEVKKIWGITSGVDLN